MERDLELAVDGKHMSELLNSLLWPAITFTVA